jgi:hypothetical protein
MEKSLWVMLSDFGGGISDTLLLDAPVIFGEKAFG